MGQQQCQISVIRAVTWINWRHVCVALLFGASMLLFQPTAVAHCGCHSSMPLPKPLCPVYSPTEELSTSPASSARTADMGDIGRAKAVCDFVCFCCNSSSVSDVDMQNAVRVVRWLSPLPCTLLKSPPAGSFVCAPLLLDRQ